MRALITLLTFIVCIQTYAQSNITNADWSNITYYYDDQSKDKDKDKKPKDPVPEPATYGFVMVGTTLAYATMLRRKPRK